MRASNGGKLTTEQAAEVIVTLEWADEPFLTIDESDPERVEVIAHPGLSDKQVARACQELDGYGQLVLQAWRAAVARGTTPSAR